MDQSNQECCPKFDPAPWDGKIFDWQNKKFIKDKVFTIFYMPINFGKVITKMNSQTTAAGAKCQDWMCLSDHTSKWNMNLYLAVDKEVPGADNVTLSGKFLTKAYEGDFRQTGEWAKDFKEFVKNKNLEIKKLFMWYTTCPKCAKKYGKNYTVFVAQV